MTKVKYCCTVIAFFCFSFLTTCVEGKTIPNKPAEATQSGKLKLTWSNPPGLEGNGRGVQAAEVWLICNQDMPPRGRDKEYEY